MKKSPLPRHCRAIAALLHVLLRRKTGRVTDTEWMPAKRDYAAEITRFAREKTREESHSDLLVCADKLDGVMATADARQRLPLVATVAKAVGHHRPAPHAAGAASFGLQGAKSVNTEEEIYPESGFIESTFGGIFRGSEPHKDRKPKDPDASRYIKGLR